MYPSHYAGCYVVLAPDIIVRNFFLTLICQRNLFS